MQGWGGSCRARVGYRGGVGHAGVGGSCRGGVGWVMQGWGGWVMQGWGGSCRGGVDDAGVGWGGSCRDGVGCEKFH